MSEKHKDIWVKTGIVISVLVLLALFPFILPMTLLHLATRILIFSLFAVSFNIALGYTGMIPFGHAAFFGIGAYTYSLLLVKGGASTLVGFLSAPLLAALYGLITSFFLVRSPRMSAAMLSVAFAQLLWALVMRFSGFTNGEDGIAGLPSANFLFHPTNIYYFTMIIVSISTLLLWVLVNSPFGLSLRALSSLQGNPQRAQCVGIPLKRYMSIAYTISAFFSGLSGALLAISQDGVYPTWIYWSTSGEVMVVTLLGGMFTFMGPVLGAAVFFILDDLITPITVHWPTLMGLILIVIVLYFKGGIMGYILQKVKTKSIGREVTDR